ncbi:hypothetical protein [Nanchangia anserum]|uniref:hypothetical protein n=1 Tax=Nanchangia anserum TaxID=2692125 RepID=UPI001D101FA2|nr:hypothetical protein [Nanchangia anserum]
MGSPFPRHVGPPLSEAERRIGLSTRRDCLAVAISAALSLVTSLCAAMVCVWIGDVVTALPAGAVPLGIHPIAWIVLAGLSEAARIGIQQRSAARLVARLQTRLMRHAFALGPARLAARRTGGLIALMTQGVEKIALYRQTYLGPLAGAYSPRLSPSPSWHCSSIPSPPSSSSSSPRRPRPRVGVHPGLAPGRGRVAPRPRRTRRPLPRRHSGPGNARRHRLGAPHGR